MVLTANQCGVNLRSSGERKIWKDLAKLPNKLTKYPCVETLARLGLLQSFNELCAAGHLTVLFTPDISSYHQLTLEFFSTLVVVKNRRTIEGIRFRLRNEEYDVSMEQFKGMFGIMVDDFDEPKEFNRHQFWASISGLAPEYHANRAKGSSIRNPVLRLIHKACASHPFARTENGSVQRDELFLLWTLLHQRPTNVAHYMLKHLERIPKKTSGALCCGGVVGSIALHLGVNTDDLEEDDGVQLMDYDYLRRGSVILTDQNGRPFLHIKDGEPFPLPNIPYTYISGPRPTPNWLLNSDAHEQARRANPPRYPFKSRDHSFIYDAGDEMAGVPPQFLELEGAEQNDDDDEEEIVPPPTSEAGPSSSSRTRGREDRFEDEITSINERLGNLEVNVQRMSTRQDEYWNQFNTRFDDQWAQFNARFNDRWNSYMEHQQEFRGYWQHPPPPPQP